MNESVFLHVNHKLYKKYQYYKQRFFIRFCRICTTRLFTYFDSLGLYCTVFLITLESACCDCVEVGIEEADNRGDRRRTLIFQYSNKPICLQILLLCWFCSVKCIESAMLLKYSLPYFSVNFI